MNATEAEVDTKLDADKEKVRELMAWLVRRSKPNSGIQYENRNAFTDEACTILQGPDATFVAEHFHGQAALELARAMDRIWPALSTLQMQSSEAVAGWKLVPGEADGHMATEAYKDQPSAFNWSATQAYRTMVANAPKPADLREALPQHSEKVKAGLESAVKSIQSRPPELRGSFKSEHSNDA